MVGHHCLAILIGEEWRTLALDSEQPDVICLQETKISQDLFDGFAFVGYPSPWSVLHRESVLFRQSWALHRCRHVRKVNH
jgi:hypothetical protein